MESYQKNGSSQGIGKRSASSDDEHEDKKLRPDGADSDLEPSVVSTNDDNEEDNDDFDFDEITCDIPLNISTTSKTIYNVLSPQELAVHIDQRIENAWGLLQLAPATVRVLLNHCSWNEEKLLDAYFGGGDAKTLFKDAGIESPSSQETRSGSSSSNDGTEECLICFSEMQSSELVGMNCGHKFCEDCWRTSLKSQIMEQGKGCQITCIAHKCSTLVADAMFKKLITDENVLKKYKESVVDTFVQANPSYKWCSGPDCTKVIRTQVISELNPQVKCTCGYSFCFKCSGDAHAPITCEQLTKWQAKYDPDKRSASWLQSNTKPCPKCKANIQKNGGCNLITCGKCHCYFCWICLQPLNNHDRSQCNQFSGQNAATKHRSDGLEHYTFYSDRYRSQQESLKLERQLFKIIQMQVAELAPIRPIDVNFLKEAIDVLCECRQTLQFTYVFAFFVEKSNQVDIFVENQNDLQGAVEKLSGFLEADKDEASLAEAKIKVRDLCNYCRERRQVLINHVFEGYGKGVENGGWKFNTNI